MPYVMCFLLCWGAVLAMGQAEVLHPILDPSNHLEELVEDTSGWDSDYRTSREEGARGTQFRYDVEHPPSGSVRIGSICMDGTTTDLKGGGACSGYGGVRHWLYRLPDGSEQKYATRRHEEHPEPLSKAELEGLLSRQKQKKFEDAYEGDNSSSVEAFEDLPSEDKGMKYGSAYQGRNSWFSWEELMAVMMICVTIAYIARLFWGRNKHDDLLD
jgi:hypothetical protein